MSNPNTPQTTKLKNRPTEQEHEERVELVVKLMVVLARKWEIKRALDMKYGDISARTVERYMSRAREKLREYQGKSKEELLAESVGYYASILKSTDPKVTARDKMFARQRLDELFGLQAPMRHELSGPDGGPIQTKTTFADFMEEVEKQEARENRVGSMFPATIIPDKMPANGNG